MGAVRFFLAIIVCIAHWQFIELAPKDIIIPGRFLLGFNAGYAVLFFYVISGFLITFTLSKNYEPTAFGIGKFYFNRFIRIFSVYWPLVILALLTVPEARERISNAVLVDKMTAIFLLGTDWRVSFGTPESQYFGGNIVGMSQAWTLGAELTFYVLAPMLMRSWKLAAALLLMSLALRASFVIALGRQIHDLWTYTFFPSTIVFFMLVHVAYRAAQQWPSLSSPRFGCWWVAFSFAFMFLWWRQWGFDTERLWVSVVFFTIGLPGFFNATKGSVLLNRLGDLSYPVYLVHVFVAIYIGDDIIAAAFGFLPEMPHLAAFISVGAFVVVVVIAATAVHYLVERPIAAGAHK